MIDDPGYAGQSVLNSFVFDSGPQRASSHARGTLLRVDDRILGIAREVGYKTIFCRRRARGAMATAADHNLEVVRPSILQRKRNVVHVFHEGDNTSIALDVGGPSSDGLGINLIVWGHNIPLKDCLNSGRPDISGRN